MKTLKEEQEAIIEEMLGCSSDIEFAKNQQDHKDAVIGFKNTLRTALLSHEEKVVARVMETIRKERLTWVKGSIGDNALESLELALTLPITDENGAFYIVGKDWETTIASILENNAQVPYKYPMNIYKSN